MTSRLERKKRRRLKKPVRNVLIIWCVLIVGLVFYNLTIKPAKTYTKETEHKEKAQKVDAPKKEPVQNSSRSFPLGN